MKKIYILISIILATFIFYLFILFLPKNYKLVYSLDNFEITELYTLNNEMYKILINFNNQNYPLTFNNKYFKDRKIVQKITKIDTDNEKCLMVFIDNKKYPICYKDEYLIDFRLLSEDIKEKYKDLIPEYSNKIIKTYKNTNIYNYFDKKFFVWNYKGYDYLSEAKNKTINLLKEDSYSNPLVFKNDNYIITPNYDEKYYFTEFLIIDNKELELYNFDLKKEISYSSYYLGEIKNTIYLVDKKNKKEYKINIKKESIKTIGTENKKGIIYTNQWEDISLNKLINKEYTFPVTIKYNYQIIDNNLYLVIDESKILLSKNKIKDIIYINGNEVYYLSQDILYVYTPEDGEVKLIENNEWNFNYDNKIFIID